MGRPEEVYMSCFTGDGVVRLKERATHGSANERWQICACPGKRPAPFIDDRKVRAGWCGGQLVAESNGCSLSSASASIRGTLAPPDLDRSAKAAHSL